MKGEWKPVIPWNKAETEDYFSWKPVKIIASDTWECAIYETHSWRPAGNWHLRFTCVKYSFITSNASRLGQFLQLLKTRLILILIFTRPHAITYTYHILYLSYYKCIFPSFLLPKRTPRDLWNDGHLIWISVCQWFCCKLFCSWEVVPTKKKNKAVRFALVFSENSSGFQVFAKCSDLSLSRRSYIGVLTIDKTRLFSQSPESRQIIVNY